MAFITARKRSLGQGNVFTPVCHSVHWGEGGLDTEPPPGWADPPWMQTPWADPPTRYGQQAGDIHPTGMHTCSPVRFHYNLQICILYHTSYCYFYRPQRSWGKVMFLQASVILLTGVGCLPQCMLGYTPPEQTTPLE